MHGPAYLDFSSRYPSLGWSLDECAIATTEAVAGCVRQIWYKNANSIPLRRLIRAPYTLPIAEVWLGCRHRNGTSAVASRSQTNDDNRGHEEIGRQTCVYQTSDTARAYCATENQPRSLSLRHGRSIGEVNPTALAVYASFLQ